MFVSTSMRRAGVSTARSTTSPSTAKTCGMTGNVWDTRSGEYLGTTEVATAFGFIIRSKHVRVGCERAVGISPGDADTRRHAVFIRQRKAGNGRVYYVATADLRHPRQHDQCFP